MSMSLQHDGPGAHDFPALASLMAFGAHLVEATVRSRQRLGLGQGALAHPVGLGERREERQRLRVKSLPLLNDMSASGFSRAPPSSTEISATSVGFLEA
jgi:hypothetical protein